jgi:hypothetical protein
MVFSEPPADALRRVTTRRSARTRNSDHGWYFQAPFSTLTITRAR